MTTASDLTQQHCVPCEGGVPALTPEQIRDLQPAVPQWQVIDEGKKIRRQWRAHDFAAALEFLNAVGKVAEEENHHPDLHLTGYRQLAVELSTHAIAGLSENDFILAAKIDRLPIRVKKS